MGWVGRTSGLWIKRNYIQTCYRSHYTLSPVEKKKKKTLTSSSNPAFQAGCRKGVELVSWFLCGKEESSFSLSHAEYFGRSINGGNHYLCLPNNPTSSRHLVWLHFSKTLEMGVAIGHALAREMGAPVAWVTLRAVSNVSLLFLLTTMTSNVPNSDYSINMGPGERVTWRNALSQPGRARSMSKK